LLSLGFYCMVGGGMTPILAAGFTNVAETYDVSVPDVALTTGLYMMGMGVGSVFASPTAILFGKRPVYLASCILFMVTSIWCAVSPSYPSLVAARVLQGVSVSPVECLPSATIAEIFFLHERAYRLGIYTLLLLGGKNLVPLVSAVIIQSLDWRWVFWIVTIVVGFCWFLLFFFVPETFWDRTPRPKSRTASKRPSIAQFYRKMSQHSGFGAQHDGAGDEKPHGASDVIPGVQITEPKSALSPGTPRTTKRSPLHVGFSMANQEDVPLDDTGSVLHASVPGSPIAEHKEPHSTPNTTRPHTRPSPLARHSYAWKVEPQGDGPRTPSLHNFNSPYYTNVDDHNSDYVSHGQTPLRSDRPRGRVDGSETDTPRFDSDNTELTPVQAGDGNQRLHRYTTILKESPRRTFWQQLKPFEGRLHHDNWFKVAVRPLILFAYPAVLWSAVVYSCSVGWLIVLSESVAVIYRESDTYHFSALSTGLVYLSPFIGGVLGTAVAGKVSDIIVRAMARRNGGLYEPEFRLVMAIPVAITTVIGLMGFGWSAEEKDHWMVPTFFFGVISFGCSLGSTTAISFCVDSYRQYAGEALVTLNFSKNVFHGLVFSLFVNHWLESNGSKEVFVALGGIQLACLLTTIPMYIFGKRARMWTVRKNLMEKF
jgi:MFS family permease